MSDFNFDLAEAVVEFAIGSEANWNTFALPIPQNITVFTTDSKKFKRGDGQHKYSELPDGPSLAGIAAGGQEVLNVLTTLIPADTDSIIIIDDEIYKPSATRLTDITARLTAIMNKDTVQDADLATANSQFTMLDNSIISGDTGKLAIIGSHKMKPGVIPDSLIAVAPMSPISIRSLKFYSDKFCTIPCTSFNHDSKYYAMIDACHDTADVDTLTFSLTEADAYVSTTSLGRGLFQINITKPPVANSVVLTATATYNADTVSIQKTIDVNKYSPILISVYGGSGIDSFSDSVVDSSNNIICVGATTSEGLGIPTYNNALIVKFDNNLNILAKKRYSGNTGSTFNSVCIDSLNNICVAGQTSSEGVGSPTYTNALVIKFDGNLNIIARKVYSGAGGDYFRDIAVDSSNNIICVGDTASEGTATDAIIIKFDTNLNIVTRKRCGGAAVDNFYSVAIDASDNSIYAAGQTYSEGAGGGDGLVIKFDTSLNIVAQKRYGGANNEHFNGIDAANGIVICVGYTFSEGSNYSALLIKLDASLNMLAKKRYGGAGESFNKVKIDSSGNIYCTGYTASEGPGTPTYGNGFVIKFDSNMNIITKKLCIGTGEDYLAGIALDSFGNIICSGSTYSEGAGSSDTLIVKLPAIIQSGITTGTVLTTLTLTDISTLVLYDSNMTFASSNLTSANSVLTLTDSALTLADSNLTQEKDEFY